MHRYSLADPKVAEVVGIVAATPGAVLFVHCGVLSVGVRRKLGLASRFELRYGQPLDVQRFAVDHPSLPIIVPHFGAGFFREALMLAEACPNVVLDTSSTNGWVRYHPGLTLTDVFRTAMAVVGPDRLMFGTDSSFFPRGWQAPIYDTQRAILEQLGTEDGFRARSLAAPSTGSFRLAAIRRLQGQRRFAQDLLDARQLHVEHERRVARECPAACRCGRRRGSAGITSVRFAADLHPADALIPAGDHFALAERELDRLAAIAGAVELTTVVRGFVGMEQPAGVVHRDAPARARLAAGSGGDLRHFEADLVGLALAVVFLHLALLLGGRLAPEEAAPRGDGQRQTECDEQ